MADTTSFLTRKAAARYCEGLGLPITHTTLTDLALQDKGPKYSIWGRNAVYAREDIDRWIESRLGHPLKTG